MATIACSKDEVPAPQDEPEFYTVNLGWEGEILDVSYEPLTRGNSADDLYGIQVYSTPENGEGEPVWTNYAYGLFDGATDITINLLKGYKYKFVATMVRDGKNKVTHSSDNTYSLPFALKNYSMGIKQVPVNDVFEYQGEWYMYGLASSTTNLAGYNNNLLRANIDRYYGELVDYVPGSNGDKAKIKMKRTSFGAKFIAKGKLAKEGTLHVMILGAPEMTLALTNSDNQISDMFSFMNIKAAWAENGNYTETADVTINWTRPDGTTLPLGVHKVTFKRNATTVVNVNIENDGEPEGFDFDIPESETGTPVEDGENDLTITDGVIVETEVDTNK